MIFSYSVGSIPGALATGCRDSLFGMPGSNTSGLAFSSERKNRTHLSRIRPLSRSSHPPRHGCAVIRPSSSPPDAPILCLEEFILVSHAQLLLHLNDVALGKTNDCCTSHSLQPVTWFPDSLPQLRIPGVRFQALSRCVHRISHSLQLSFRFGVSTPTSPWHPPFLRRDHHFSGPHDDYGECVFHVVYIAVSRRVYPVVLSNRCGHLLAKLGISQQAPTVYWRLS